MARRGTSMPMGTGTASFYEGYKQKWDWALKDAKGHTVLASRESTLDQAIKACYQEAKRRGMV